MTLNETNCEVGDTPMGLTLRKVFIGRSMKIMCDACKDVNQFLAFMTTKQGVPTITVDCLDWIIKNGFFEAPASTKFHGSYEGGLFDHSFSVTKHLIELTERNGLIYVLKYIINTAGFDLINRIEVRDRKTGRDYR